MKVKSRNTNSVTVGSLPGGSTFRLDNNGTLLLKGSPIDNSVGVIDVNQNLTMVVDLCTGGIFAVPSERRCVTEKYHAVPEE